MQPNRRRVRGLSGRVRVLHGRGGGRRGTGGIGIVLRQCCRLLRLLDDARLLFFLFDDHNICQRAHAPDALHALPELLLGTLVRCRAAFTRADDLARPLRPRHYSLHVLHVPRQVREVEAAITRDHHIILEAHTSDGQHSLENFQVNEARHGLLAQCLGEQRLNEVDGRLHRQYHASLERARRAQIARASTARPRRRLVFDIPANVVRVDAQKVAHSVRHENGRNSHAQHVVNLTDEQACVFEPHQQLPLTEPVHRLHADAWTNGRQYRALRTKHGLIEPTLVSCETAVDGVSAGDVRAVTAVLAAEVEEHHLTVAHEPRVRGARVAVVQLRGAAAAGDYGRVCSRAHAPAAVALEEKARLRLVFVHTRAHLAHDGHMRGTADLIGVRDQLDLRLALDDAALAERIV
mmetsp:Transcript_12576/g.52914  ORF Transcript_12576/g.52914 Transcript_12576/m.52914 type:complete len:407 (+) Transcript_12576:258-1478(+)